MPGPLAATLCRQAGRTLSTAIALYGKLFTGVSARLVAADLMLKTGRLEAARQSLDAIRGDLYDLRKATGIAVLADCVRDANTAMDALMVYNDRALDWTKAETRFGIASKASIYGTCSTAATAWRAKRCARRRNSAAWSTAPRPAWR